MGCLTISQYSFIWDFVKPIAADSRLCLGQALNCKGFIYAHGKWSCAYTPYKAFKDVDQTTVEIPSILFTIAMMVRVGIQKIMVGSTPETIVLIRDILQDSNRIDADISYLLLNEDAGIDQATVACNEFAAQSSLFVAGAGLCCIGAEFPNLLKTALKKPKGVTGFRMKSGMLSENQFIPDMLVLAPRVIKAIRDSSDSISTAGIQELRKYCAVNFRYSEVDFGESCYFANLIHTEAVDEDFVTSDSFDEILKQISRTSEPSET